MLNFRKICKPCDPHGHECGLDDFIEYYSHVETEEELTARWNWSNGLISDREYPHAEEIRNLLKFNKRKAFALYKVNKA